MQIYYPFPEKLPDLRARFIQTMNTCQALAQSGANVTLLTGLKPEANVAEIPEFYRLDHHPRFAVKPLPMLRGGRNTRFRLSWHGVFNTAVFLSLWKNRPASKEPAAIYARHLKLAEFLLKRKRLLKMPVIYEVHELFHLTTDNHKRREQIKKRETWVLTHCDALVCTSSHLKKTVSGMGVTAPIQVAPNGFRSDWKIGRDPSANRVFYAGSLYPWKGVDTLIEAATFLPDQHFLIVGGGERLPELEMKAANLAPGRFQFTGSVPHEEMPDWLSKAGIAVLPNIPDISSQFSSPLKLFEYMAFGLPVVASDIPIFREILQPGKNASLFTPSDPKSLAEAIQALVDHPEQARRLAETAGQEAADYTYEKRGERILEMLKGLSFHHKA